MEVNKQLSFEDIISVLGEPFFKSSECLIFNTDCVSAMQLLKEQIPEKIFDCTVTSPPYNIGKEYEESLPLKDYLDWCEKWMSLVHELTKLNGSFWLNLGYLKIDKKVSHAIIFFQLTPSRAKLFQYHIYFGTRLHSTLFKKLYGIMALVFRVSIAFPRETRRSFGTLKIERVRTY
jgi:DNA modification methylase